MNSCCHTSSRSAASLRTWTRNRMHPCSWCRRPTSSSPRTCICSWQKKHIWMAPWKNRITSTTMKLRKSLVKPVTRQNISSCSVLSPEIVIHGTFNVILWTSADICVIMHDDLGWKNWTTRYILPHHWLYEWFSSPSNIRRYMHRAWRSRVKERNNML